MSALPPMADIDQQGRDVRFVPKSGISRGNPVARRQGGKLHTARSKEWVGNNKKGVRTLAFKRSKDLVDLADRRCVDDLGLQPHGGSGFLHFVNRGLGN